MPAKKNKSIGLFCILLCCLAGCAVGPDYHPVNMPVPDTFAASNSGASKSDQPVIDATVWWKSLKDPELNSLVD